MATFARIDDDGNIIKVHKVANEVLGNPEDEQKGKDLLKSLHGGTDANWVQGSVNTKGGVYYKFDENLNYVVAPENEQSKARRYNPPSRNGTYNSEADAFILPKPYNSWVLDTNNYTWKAPVDKPADFNTVAYVWDEDTTNWIVDPKYNI